MKPVNDPFAELQKQTLKNLEPMQNLNSVAAEAFERIARKNHDLMGDLVEYAVSQVQPPSADANLQEVYEQRVADTKAFAEKVNVRASEYVALAGELGELAQPKAKPEAEAKAAPAKKPASGKKKASARSKKTTAKSK